VVPVILGLALVALVAFLVRLCSGRDRARRVVVDGVLPTAVRHSVVGRSDQHVAEVLLCGLACYAYVAGFRRRRAG